MAAFDGTMFDVGEEFDRHLAKIAVPSWVKSITLHATWNPNIEVNRDTPYLHQDGGRRKGPDIDKACRQRMINSLGRVRELGGGWNFTVFENGKIGEGWSLLKPGVHAVGWNNQSWSVEMCANFDGDARLPNGTLLKGNDPYSGPGLVILETTAWLFSRLLRKLGKPANNDTIKLHRENAKAKRDGKLCPGKYVDKADFIKRVQRYMDGDKPIDLSPEARPPVTGNVQPSPAWTIREVQEHLTRLGYDPGPIDGIDGPKTQGGVRAFQEAMGVARTGKVGPWIWNKLATLEPPAALSEAPSPIPAPEPEKPLSGEGPNQLKGRDRPLYVKRVLQELGWKDFQAAAIVGNLMRESYPDLRTHVEGDKIDGQYTALGIGQWRLDRKDNLLKRAEALGKDWKDLDFQARFVDWELRHTERLAGDALKVATNLHDSLLAAIGYERPAKWTRSNPMRGDGWDKRKEYAESLLT